MRLIDAEALKNKVIEQISSLETRLLLDKDFITETKIVWFIKLLKIIENFPTIEAKPVVHAHWEETGFVLGICSHCGGMCPKIEYCGRCGARMDENYIAEDSKKEPICGCAQDGVKIPVISMEDVPKIMEELPSVEENPILKAVREMEK